MTGTLSEQAVFTFDGTPGAAWAAVDDGVMGGRSRSQFTATADGTALFSGTVSFENNGGFCSARSPDLPRGWGGCRAVHLRVRGDGKTYTLCLHTRGLMSGSSYRCRFTPPAGEWADVELRLERFVLMRFGYRVGVEPVNPAHVSGVSLMISDKQEGAFALEVARIAVG
jgi:monofunctional biosynthetic peptidoglycan transglycosylase